MKKEFTAPASPTSGIAGYALEGARLRAKKKPKDASAKKVQSFLEPPANVEVIKPHRKPKPVVEEAEESDES